MFSITIFLCVVVTVMLLAFIGYHTWLIKGDRTTNEQMKRQQIGGFVAKKMTFLNKWKVARDEGKPFKPTKKSVEMYEVKGDVKQVMTDDEFNAVYDKVQKQNDTIDAGSYYKSASFQESLLKIWDPDTYDCDANPDDWFLEKQVKPNENKEGEKELKDKRAPPDACCADKKCD